MTKARNELPTPPNFEKVSPDRAWIGKMSLAKNWLECWEISGSHNPYPHALQESWYRNARDWVEEAGPMPDIANPSRRNVALYLEEYLSPLILEVEMATDYSLIRQ